MADVYLFPGQDATHTFYIRSGNGAVLTADSTPVCTLIRNGVDTAESVTVTQQPDGSYLTSFLIPVDWESGDIVTMRVEAVVSGNTVPPDTLLVGTVITLAQIQDGEIDLVQAQYDFVLGSADEMYQRYRDAEIKLLDGQSVSWGDRTLTLADLAEVKSGRAYWERRRDAEILKNHGKRKSFGAQAVW